MIALTIVHVILSIALIVIVLAQSGADQGVPGVVGGNSDSFFGRNSGRSADAILSRCTTVVAVLFIVTSIVLSLILNK